MAGPVWFLPSLAVPIVLGLWLAATIDARADRVVSRFARLLFGRFVDDNEDRSRRLEAAYVGEPYTSYATTTLLYAALAFIAGSIAGAYLLAGVLLVFEDFVRLLTGLPDSIAVALGARLDYELILSQRQRWAILLGGATATGALAAAAAYALRWTLPASTAEVRRRSIEEGLPRTTAFAYALSRGGIEFPDVVRTLSDNREVYGEAAKEMSLVAREMDLFGRDMITALRRMAQRTPSEQFKTFSENLSSVLQGGSGLPEFLDEQYERFRQDAEDRQEEVLEVLATVAEGYVTVLVAGVLFLVTILIVFGLTTTPTLWLLALLAYLVVPLANAGFAVFLDQQMTALGISRQTGAGVLDRLETETPSESVPESRRGDGGRDRETRVTLTWYDRLERVRHHLRHPVRVLVRRPTALLYVTVPVALGAIALRLPAATTARGVSVRVLDDILVQSALFVLVTFAVVRHLYTRRLKRIEAATPDMLERLASLNGAGLSVVEGFDRLRGSDLGVLSPEVDRIHRDVEYGSNVSDALVRFGRRVRTVTVTRVVVLLTNAMRASGNLGPVLRIAAEQSRADLDLRRRRRREMFTYLVVIYVAFAVFLVILLAVNEVLVPSLPESVPSPSQDQLSPLDAGAGIADQLASVDKAAYTLVFFHTALVQAVASGFVGGQFGEGTLRDGAKHAAIMLTITYVVFLLVSSPVASVTTGEAVSTGDTLFVDGASLSAGGFVAVYDDGVNSSRLGQSAYVPPGSTDAGVRVDLKTAIRENRTVTVVPHRDTNGNRQFDYPEPSLPTRGSVADRPYPGYSSSGGAGAEVQVTYVGD